MNHYGAQYLVKVTPTVSNNVAYSSGDQVGGIMTITNGAFDEDRVVKLSSLTVMDREQQDPNLTVYFFDDLPTLGGGSLDNGAFDITDAEVLAKCVGFVAIGSSDYVDADEVAVVTKTPNLIMKSVHADSTNKKTGNLYAVAVTTSTPTFTSTASLKFVFGFEA